MKKIGYLIVIVLCVALVLELCSCSFFRDLISNTNDDFDKMEGIYYAVKNGKFEPDNWFNVSKDGTWTDDDGLDGTWTVTENKIYFHWAFTIDGIIDGDSFYLIELDEVVEYVKRDSAPKQGEFWTDKYIILLDTDGGSVSEEILKYHSGDEIFLPTPEKENGKFKGWFDLYDKKYTTGTSMPAKNIVLYAEWEQKVTDYSDEYVFFSPAIEGKKQIDEYYYLYSNITKYIYVELNCDSVGGKYNLGMPSNFDLLDHIDMQYYVQSSDYQLKWYYGDWSQPNGSQTFTLNYGSNIQLLAVENAQGQIQCRYLLDFYVKRDVEIELYSSVSATYSYDTVRGYKDEMIDERDLEPYDDDEFDYWLYYNTTTKSYEPYDFTTVLTDDIALYQSLKGVDVDVDLNGGTMAETSFKIKPYEEDQILPTAQQDGYDFIGWMDSDGNYFVGYDGNLLFPVADDTMPSKLTASFIPKKYYANISDDNVKFVDTKVYVIYGFTTVDIIGYKLANNTDNNVDRYLYEIGEECDLPISHGYALEGWYDGADLISEIGKNIILKEELLNKNLTRKTFAIPVNLEKNIDVAGVVESDDVAYVGTELSITASTTPGFTFLGWYDGDVLLTNEETYTFVLTNENKTFTATWDTAYDVPEGTSEITAGQFKNWDFLTSITIPDSVTSIGSSAFENCTGLTSITIPDGVTSIGYSAFSGCSSLESITIPFVGRKAGVTSSDTYQYPFGYIFGTSSYTGGTATEQYYYGSSSSSTTYNTYYIPSSLKSVTVTGGNILRGAFENCSRLTSVTIGNSVTSIGSSAFENCSGLTSATIGNGVASIGSSAFENCSRLTSVTIGNSVTSIGYSAFRGCSGLTSITIPDSVTSIDYSAFRGCSGLTSITIPDSVTSIGDSAFSGCSGLTTVNWNATACTSAGSYGYPIFNSCANLATVNIGNNVTTIPTYAFYNCSGLTSITIPDSVTSIGDSAFENCSGLTSITIPDSVTSIGGAAFRGCSGLTSITIPDSVTSIGYSAFYNCSGLTSITIPDSVTSIGDSAFYNCSGLTSITIPDNVTSINDYAFYNCSKLTSITIPDSVARIGSYAFAYCSGLTSITIPDSVTSIGYSAFYNCSGLTTVNWNATACTSAGSYSYPIFSGCTNLATVNIGDNVTSIPSYAFYNCSGLTSIEIPDSVTSIGTSAFYGCSGLTSITISDSVTSIGSGALSGCSALESITIPFVGRKAGVTSSDTYQYPFGYIFGTSSYTGGTATEQYYYGSSTSSITSSTYYIPSTLKSVTITGGSILSRAFYNCSGLTSITIPDSVTSIGYSAFYNCSGLTSITIPDSVTSIGDSAFYNCSGLTSITIPDSVTSIGHLAFSGCTGLTSITIPDSVTSIGGGVFSGCTGLTSVMFKDTTNWYITPSISDWRNKIGGSRISVTKASTNATYFKDTYKSYYWYKK